MLTVKNHNLGLHCDRRDFVAWSCTERPKQVCDLIAPLLRRLSMTIHRLAGLAATENSPSPNTISALSNYADNTKNIHRLSQDTRFWCTSSSIYFIGDKKYRFYPFERVHILNEKLIVYATIERQSKASRKNIYIVPAISTLVWQLVYLTHSRLLCTQTQTT